MTQIDPRNKCDIGQNQVMTDVIPKNSNYMKETLLIKLRL